MTTKRTSSAKTKSSTGSGGCWPGFTHVEGKKAGTKGSCKPKKKQTSGEKKADQKAAAASKQRKGA